MTGSHRRLAARAIMGRMDRAAQPDEAVRAALEAGAAAGYGDADFVVFQDTNNIVVRLAPHPVVAKVGVWPHSAEVLGREVQVCAHLAERGAPVAPPIGPLREALGHPVSLWTLLDPVADAQRAVASELADVLQRVHAGLRDYAGALPSYLAAIDYTRDALAADDRMAALPADDLTLLRTSFDRWVMSVRDLDRTDPNSQQPLHGEPHLGNFVLTADGPVLIDFEAASLGPVEWDVASLPSDAAACFTDIDADHLALLRLLNSARVATWCWAAADNPMMRGHGEHHLALIRAAATS